MRRIKDTPFDKIKLQIAILAVSQEFGAANFLRGDNSQQSLLRQITMYLVHTVFGFDQSRTARLFSRHPSSVSYACSVIEDQRNDPVFNGALTRLESSLRGSV